MNLDAWFEHRLNEQKNKNIFRTLTETSSLIDFCSNDYLGLAQSQPLYLRIQSKYQQLTHLNGATGSRLLSGNSKYTEEVEQKLATVFKSQRALILNSGYAANVAIYSSIPQKGDTILLDELAHASIKDGARLSLAKRFTFRHNDLNDLEAKLMKASGRIFIGVESIYSMDGDQCPLHELNKLAKKYDAYIILDEAHSTGVVGDHGGGLATSLGIENDIAIRLYTFGKAAGIHGACIAGSSSLIEYIVNFARPFIYTTAMSPHCIVSIDCAVDYFIESKPLRNQLKENVTKFLAELSTLNNRTPSDSAIQTLIFSGNDNVKNAAAALQRSGFNIRPIVSPTVRVGAERLRIILHSFNTADEIVSLTEHLKKLSYAQ